MGPVAQTWLEARVPVRLQAQGQALARWLKMSGAAVVWRQEGQLRAVWPAGEAGRAAAAELARRAGEAAQVHEFCAPDPRAAFSRPPEDPIHPGLALTPAWSGLPPTPSRLVIDPLTAFGAGDHPSTRLNLLLLSRLLAADAPPAGAWAADVGAGTGVLALAMALIAGLQVAAMDPDPAAARATARNCGLNPLAGGRVHFVRATHAALAGRLPLIAANLPGPLLIHTAPHLAGCLAPGGRLVVSGFRDEFAGQAAEVFGGLGMVLQDEATQAGWTGQAWAASVS
ncbi:MAG: 50S ribosomal protein L11 methyltransferase [Pseudomonadota bacterium]